MNSNHASAQHPKTRSRRAVKMIVALTIAMAAIGLSTGTASAANISRWGYAGGVGVPATQGYLEDDGTATIVMPSRSVSESPRYARYNQKVCATYRFFSLGEDDYGDLHWYREGSGRQCVWIPAGASNAVVRGVYLDDLEAGWGYSVDVKYTWQLPNGALIGTRYVDSVHQSDFACYTDLCYTANSGIGAYMALG